LIPSPQPTPTPFKFGRRASFCDGKYGWKHIGGHAKITTLLNERGDDLKRNEMSLHCSIGRALEPDCVVSAWGKTETRAEMLARRQSFEPRPSRLSTTKTWHRVTTLCDATTIRLEGKNSWCFEEWSPRK
jgi:hypothetical protein